MTRIITTMAVMLTALLPHPSARAIDTTVLPNPELQARYVALTHELRCMKCQNQSIADSPVGLAADLRKEVQELLLAGKSDEQVRDFMVARYSEFILFRPRLAAHTAWLWIAPFAMLALGGIAAVRIVRRRSSLVDGDPDPVDEAATR